MAGQSAQTPTETDNLLAAARAQLARVHTSIPGVVRSYDSATQTAVVQPVVRFKFRDGDGAIQNYTPEPIADVPVAFPGAGSFSITWPLAAGDLVTLVFAERSITEWKATAGATVEAADTRRFDLTDAIAIPSLRSPADPIPGAGIAANVLVVRAPEIRLGSSVATAFVALANLVLDRLTAIVTGFNTHTHTTGVGPTGVPNSLLAVPASVAATKVKAE